MNSEFEQISQHLISGRAGKLAEYIFTREATKLSIKKSPREHRAGKNSYLKTLPFRIFNIRSVYVCFGPLIKLINTEYTEHLC